MAITTTVYTAKLAPARTLRVRGPVTLCFSSICFMPSEDNLATLISISVTRRGFSLCGGSQRLSRGRRVGVTVNSTHYHVSDRSRD